MGYSPWGHKESDTTERLHSHSESSGKWRSKKERNSKVEFFGLKIYRESEKEEKDREKKKDCGSLCYYFYYVAKLFLYQYPQICR